MKKIISVLFVGSFLWMCGCARPNAEKDSVETIESYESLSKEDLIKTKRALDDELWERNKDNKKRIRYDSIVSTTDSGTHVLLTQRIPAAPAKYKNLPADSIIYRIKRIDHLIKLDRVISTVYGTFDVYEIFEREEERITKNIRHTLAIIPKKRMIWDDTKQKYKLKNRFGGIASRNALICTDEKFSRQPNSAVGTAFLVRPEAIITAGHCISSQENERSLDSVYFVSGYELDKNGNIPEFFNESQVLEGKETHRHDNVDVALITLKKPVKWYSDVAIYRNDVNIRERVVMIGHPLGWPKKYADNARVIRMNGHYVVSDLDAFTYNSGSPVFLESGEFLGIFVRGGGDFIFSGRCDKYKICRQVSVNPCSGEEFCQIGKFEALMLD